MTVVAVCPARYDLPPLDVETLMRARAIIFDPTDRSYRHLTGIGPDVPAFLAWFEHEKGRRPRTAEMHENALRRFAWFLGPKPLEQVTKDDCRAFLATFVDEHGQLYPVGRRNAWAALRVFFRFWHREERIEKNPMLYIDSPPAKRQPPQDLFEPWEVAAIAKAASERFYLRDLAGALLLFYAGLRGGELRDLRVGDVDLRARKIIIREGKGGKRRVVPFEDGGDLHNALLSLTLLPVHRLGRDERPSRSVTSRDLVETDYVFFRVRANATGPCAWPSQPCSDSSYNGWWHDLLDEAGVTYRVPHTARHTFATNLARLRSSAADAKTLQKILGHSSVQITMDLYVWPTEGDAEALVSRLSDVYKERS